MKALIYKLYHGYHDDFFLKLTAAETQAIDDDENEAQFQACIHALTLCVN